MTTPVDNPAVEESTPVELTTPEPKAKDFDPRPLLMSLKGKPYLEVKWRIVWLVTDCEKNDWSYVIRTERVDHDRDNREAVYRASVTILDKNDRVLASADGHGTEDQNDFGDYQEKAETKAIGRALASLGYGTQFTDDHDMEGKDGQVRVVDSPGGRPKSSSGGEKRVMSFGKK